ncbi:MAG: hypothetical protein ACRCYL_18480 [Kluyvera sp.]
MLDCLFKIKGRREDRLRRQMREVTHLHQQAEQQRLQCQAQRDELTQKLFLALSWSGTLTAGELMMQKQTMNNLFREECSVAQQQRSLADTQRRLQEQLNQLRCELVKIMKKKEKLRSLLNDEC